MLPKQEAVSLFPRGKGKSHFFFFLEPAWFHLVLLFSMPRHPDCSEYLIPFFFSWSSPSAQEAPSAAVYMLAFFLAFGRKGIVFKFLRNTGATFGIDWKPIPKYFPPCGKHARFPDYKKVNCSSFFLKRH